MKGLERICGVLLVAACVLACGLTRAAEPTSRLESLQGVAGFYAEHCVRCHKEGKAKGGFRMDELLAKPTVEGLDDPWRNVLEKLSGREMPPAGDRISAP